MNFSRSDMETLTWAQHKFVPPDFDGQSSPQYIEELVGHLVVVSNLRRTGRHSFFDNAQGRGLDQVPSNATITP